jgi:hypothetical protein
MKTQTFKENFALIAKESMMEPAFNGWYLQSKECFFVITLQKSSFSSLYYLNMFIFIQGYYDDFFPKITKEMMKGKNKSLFRREDKSFSRLFDLENNISDAQRIIDLQIFLMNGLFRFQKKHLLK